MTTLDKLVIQGIRSYDPAGSATIAFWRPLTLITGENGAGKTTIIEALRYACTGRCPGHGFVHDAKLAGNASVTGRVVLRFRTAPPRQELCTVLRTVSVTQQSTRSGLAEFAHEGGGKTSGATAVNEVVPAVMGVSVPVIDYVMFCHQEDSNWPLSAGAELERRFEEIFSATRYARALDALHKARKAFAQKGPALAERLRALRALQAQLDGLRRSIADAAAHAAQRREQVAALDADAAAARAAAQRHAHALAAHEALAAQERCLAAQLDTEREHCRALAAALDAPSRLDAPTAQLEREQADVAAALRALADHAGLRAVADLEARARDAQRDVQRLHDTLVRLRASEADRAARAAACVARCRAFARECLPEASRGDGDDNEDPAALQAETLRGAQGVLDGAQARHDSAVQQREAALAPVRAQVAALRGTVSVLQGQIDSRTHGARETAERLGYEQDMVTEKKRELGESEQAAARAREQEAALAALEVDAGVRGAALGETMDGLARDERELRGRCAELQRQLAFAKQCLPLHTNVQRLQGQYARTKTDFDELCRSADLTGPLGSCAGKSVREITQLYRSAYRTTSDSLSKADEDKKVQDKKVNSLEVREREMAAELRELTAERDAKAKTLADVVGKLLHPAKKRGAKRGDAPPDWRKFPELLREREAAIKKTERKLILATATEELYRKFIKSAAKTCSCPLCERRLGTADGVSLPDFTSKLEDVIKALPAASAIEESKAELARQQEVVAKLHAVEAVWHRWVQLDGEEIPKRERALQDVRESLRAATQDVPQLTQVYENASRVWNRLGRAKLVLDQLRRLEPKLAEESDELENAQEALDRLVKKEASSTGGEGSEGSVAIPDIGIISTALVEAQKKYQGVSDQIARCQEERNALASRVQQQRDVVTALKSKSLETVKLQAEVSQMEKELAEKEQSLKKTQEDIERARQEQKEAAAQLDAAAQQEQQLSAEHDAAIAQLASECQRVHVAVERFKVETSQMLEQVRELGEQAAGIPGAEQRKQEAVARRDAVQAELAALRAQVENQDSAKRDLELRQKVLASNLQLRRSMAEVSSLEQQVGALRGNADYMDSTAVAQAEREHAQAEQRASTAVARANEEKGALRVLEDTLQKLRADELRPELQSAPEDYRRCMIEKETNDIMQEDLDKYEKELDKALILFHQTKMESINRRVTELWQATYRNADIDTIRIKSEVERRTVTGKRTESGRGTRYSVVMVKDGVEMDMRGRCSAGQKVLASIVIRIALAEIFCLNCGILALDEPTTNLDRRNVDSLARALHALVESQRRNATFQLVIITHDQEFADAFHCERWYKVSKPDRNQFSVITLYGGSPGRLPPPDDKHKNGGAAGAGADDDDDDDDFVDNKSRSSQVSIPWRV